MTTLLIPEQTSWTPVIHIPVTAVRGIPVPVGSILVTAVPAIPTPDTSIPATPSLAPPVSATPSLAPPVSATPSLAPPVSATPSLGAPAAVTWNPAPQAGQRKSAGTGPRATGSACRQRQRTTPGRPGTSTTP